MIQFTACAKGFGIENSGGFVDVDVTFNNYVEKAIEENVISDKETKLLLVMTPQQKSKAVYEFLRRIKSEDYRHGVSNTVTVIFVAAALAVLLQKKKRNTEEILETHILNSIETKNK